MSHNVINLLHSFKLYCKSSDGSVYRCIQWVWILVDVLILFYSHLLIAIISFIGHYSLVYYKYMYNVSEIEHNFVDITEMRE